MLSMHWKLQAFMEWGGEGGGGGLWCTGSSKKTEEKELSVLMQASLNSIT